MRLFLTNTYYLFIYEGQNGCVSPAPASLSSPWGLSPGSCPFYKYDPRLLTWKYIYLLTFFILKVLSGRTEDVLTWPVLVFFIPGPPNVSTDLNVTAAHTGTSMAAAPVILSETETTTTTTTTTSQAGDGATQPAGPNGTLEELPVSSTPVPTTVQAPLSTSPHPTQAVGENETTTSAIDPPTPEIDVNTDGPTEMETTTLPEATSDSIPHGECWYMCCDGVDDPTRSLQY